MDGEKKHDKSIKGTGFFYANEKKKKKRKKTTHLSPMVGDFVCTYYRNKIV